MYISESDSKQRRVGFFNLVQTYMFKKNKQPVIDILLTLSNRHSESSKLNMNFDMALFNAILKYCA